eukprot:g4148.t1
MLLLFSSPTRSSTLSSLLISFTHLAPTDSGDLTATLKIWSTWSIDTEKVTEIYQTLPKVTSSTSVLSSSSSKLTIQGKGFDATTPTENSVAFTKSGPGSTVSGVILSTQITTMTTLIVSFTHLAPTNNGATLSVTTTVSSLVQAVSTDVAKIVGAISTIEGNSGLVVSSDSSMLTVKGKGFDATTATNNVVTFNPAAVKGIFKSGSSVTTLTTLIVSFTHLAPYNSGVLSMTCVVSSSYSSAAGAVAKIFAAKPEMSSVTSSDVLSSDSSKLTVKGKGFDATYPTLNAVTFSPTTIKAIVTGSNTATMTTLSVSFTHLAPSNNGETLTWTSVTVGNTWSVSASTDVAKIVETLPKVTSSTSVLSSSSSKLTIQGKGFDATTPTENSVAFTKSGPGSTVSGVILSTQITTMTTLIVSFTHLAPTNNGATLSVTTTVSSLVQDSSTDVAKIVETLPEVTSSTSVLSSSSSKLTIQGKGFDATTPTENSVAFTKSGPGSTVSGVILSTQITTMTTLIVSFTHLAPTNNGATLSVTTTVSSLVQAVSTDVAKIVGAISTIEGNSGLVVSSDSSMLTVKGKGFDATTATNNVVTFNPAAVKGIFKSGSSVTTLTTLIVSFTHLAPYNSGVLSMTCVVSSSYSSAAGAVAKIFAAKPEMSSVTSSDVLSSDSSKLTVKGKGFDATYPTLNAVTFSPTTIKAIVTGSNTATMTTLSVSFTHLAPSNNGETLTWTSVTVGNTWSVSASTDVAKIVETLPKVCGCYDSNNNHDDGKCRGNGDSGATCNDNGGTGYECHCTAGFTQSSDKRSCIDIDGCSSNTCSQDGDTGATCHDVAAPNTGFTCSCSSGWESVGNVCKPKTCNDISLADGYQGTGSDPCSTGLKLDAVYDTTCDFGCMPGYTGISSGTTSEFTCGTSGGNPTTSFSCDENTCNIYHFPTGITGTSDGGCVDGVELS